MLLRTSLATVSLLLLSALPARADALTDRAIRRMLMYQPGSFAYAKQVERAERADFLGVPVPLGERSHIRYATDYDPRRAAGRQVVVTPANSRAVAAEQGDVAHADRPGFVDPELVWRPVASGPGWVRYTSALSPGTVYSLVVRHGKGQAPWVSRLQIDTRAGASTSRTVSTYAPYLGGGVPLMRRLDREVVMRTAGVRVRQTFSWRLDNYRPVRPA